MASEPKKKKTDTEQENSEPTKISRDELDLEEAEAIGKGTFGTVFKIKWKSRGYHVAAKQVTYPKEDKDSQDDVEREISILCELSHPNIVVLHGVLEEAIVSSVVERHEGAITIILELCTKGSLREFLKKNRKVKLSPAQFTAWATQAARAIEYLHKKGVIHKDIKSDNYLITDDDILKLTDFGISKFADRTVQNATSRGTIAYMPPEIHTNQELSPKFDFFSYAVVVWELLTRQIPFEDCLRMWIMRHVCDHKLRLAIPADCPEDLAKLMKQCWEEDRNRRPNIEGILSVVSKPRETLEDTERAKRETITSDIDTLSLQPPDPESLEHVPREKLELRSYQEELARPALPGPDGYKNTVIVAPTGSGKTVVAVKVVKEFLETRGAEGHRVRPMKVVFLVNKILLVEQQTKLFKRFLEPGTIDDISGGDMTTQRATQVSVKYMLEEKSILVMTAQILVNAIDSKEVTLSEIGLVIFDECHNCQGGTPYNNIMAIYRDMKLSNNDPRPQIIGMTASLFYGQALSDNQAEQNVLTLCANLDADIISTVQSTECLEELTDTQHIPDEKIVEVPGRKRGDDPFATLINSMMETIEREMQNTEGWHTLVKVNSKLLACPSHARGKNVYGSWMSNCENNVHVIITDVADKRKFIACFDHLKKYKECLDIHANIRSKDALLHLEKFRDDLSGKQQGFDDTDRKLVKLFDEKQDQLQQISDNPAYHNPVLKKLGVVLKTAFQSSQETGKRGILFAKTRVFTEALKNWIEETDELRFLKPGYLIGSGKSAGGVSGMSKTEQVDLVERFREGDHKLIIATSVAQEGLDISPCSVVVRYNHITDIVGRVQTRGRNRAENSVFYLVVDEQLKLSDKNVKIRIGENIMMKATRSVQKKLADNHQQIREQIEKLQRKDKQDRETRARNTKDKKSLLIRDRVKFSCRKCSKFACYSDDIRCIQGQHRAVFSKEFSDKYDVQEENKRFSEPKDIDGVVFHKTIACAECKSRWGSLGTYMDMDLPMVKPEWFTLKGEQQGLHRSKVKKWSQVWFIVDDYDESC